MAQLEYMKTELSDEQQDKLCALGIAPTIIKLLEFRFDLQDLLRMLPKDLGKDGYDTLCIETQSNGNNYFWRVYYSEHDVDTNFCEEQLIDALFELVVRFIKSEKK